MRKRQYIFKNDKQIVPSEYQECKAFWEFCQVIARLGLSAFHVPNEGIRDSWYSKALINIGLTPGVLDYIILKPNKKYKGLFIDMKRKDERNKLKRNSQQAFIKNALGEGYYACYAYGCEDAIKIYNDYIGNIL